MVPEPGLTAAQDHGQPGVPPQPPVPAGQGYPWPPAATGPQPPPYPWPGGGPVTWPPPPSRPEALPVLEREYHEFFRAPAFRWWKPLLSLLMFVATWLAGNLVLTSLALGYDVATGRTDLSELTPGSSMAEQLAAVMTPMMFAANNVSLALAVPLAGLAAWAVHRQRPRWLSSIAGRFRWGLFWRFILIAAGVLGLSLGAQVLLGGGVGELTWNGDSLFLIVTIVLTTPFQAAGEEYALRGLATRAIGSWFTSRRVGLVVAAAVTAVVFMSLHVAEDAWLNGFYLLFAVLASVMVWRTGGLEAAVALHVANNLLGEAFLPFTPIEDVFDRSAGVAGPETLWQMAAVALVAGLILWQAHRLKLPRSAAPAAPAGFGPAPRGGVGWNSPNLG